MRPDRVFVLFLVLLVVINVFLATLNPVLGVLCLVGIPVVGFLLVRRRKHVASPK